MSYGGSPARISFSISCNFWAAASHKSAPTLSDLACAVIQSPRYEYVSALAAALGPRAGRRSPVVAPALMQSGRSSELILRVCRHCRYNLAVGSGNDRYAGGLPEFLGILSALGILARSRGRSAV